MLRINEIRKDFPILDQEVFGRRLVYLDNAATMQMPEPVLQSIVRHYRNDNACTDNNKIPNIPEPQLNCCPEIFGINVRFQLYILLIFCR